MNTSQEFKDDLLREYFNTSLIEKAPAGFTEKVMTMVTLEARPVKKQEKLPARYIVPVISAVVTLILTGLVLLLPAAGNDYSALPWMKIVRNMNLQIVDLKLDSLFSFSLPAYLPYLFLCILILTIFDRGLSGLFHKGK
jgi:hypothetical protein